MPERDSKPPSILEMFASEDTELTLLAPVIRHLNAQMVVELGTEEGISTRRIADAVTATGGQFVTIDTDDCSSALTGVRCIVLKGRSEDLALNWNCPIDVLFVDTAPGGKHTYEQVAVELKLWGRFVQGCIVFHDTVSFPGVLKAITEWHSVQPNDWEFDNLPIWPGMGFLWRV